MLNYRVQTGGKLYLTGEYAILEVRSASTDSVYSPDDNSRNRPVISSSASFRYV